ncbi:AraC family transcriptional regulator [Paludicola sp. MB14-C6]|uniref:AraC family transcriptional regulator n=1 Tax=Paludihabitans sp. MB14-C6 TaxID=3070656 RepID=UPI0027DBD13F|nr:helix-turn-helix domain-containing protein [Paludicola sp. MB14-C6]WMJ22813.1 AraC family transcriptional regulator [Paludicola sp. MB14-C6]
MKVDKKYYQNFGVSKCIVGTKADKNNLVSCGLLHKTGDFCIQENVDFDYYGALYIIDGTGEYVDAVTNERIKLYPGCIVQRMPHQIHHTYVKDDGNWLEFYFCIDAKVFKLLSEYKLITKEPVFFIGEDITIFQYLLQFMDRVDNTKENQIGDLMIEFQRLLLYINQLANTVNDDSNLDYICQLIQQNLKIGANLPTVFQDNNLSYESIRKQFKQKMGCSISDYRINQRINQSKTMLLQHRCVKQVAIDLGYFDEYAFSKQFKKYVGVSPREFIRTWSHYA